MHIRGNSARAMHIPDEAICYTPSERYQRLNQPAIRVMMERAVAAAQNSTPITSPSSQQLGIMLGSPDQPQHLPKPGDILGQRYRLTHRLGVGGYSTVFAADDLLDGGSLAVKILKTQSVHNDPSALGRMRQEAELIKGIEHPNILRIYAFERHGPFAFLVMEKLHGASLAHIIHEQGPAPTERVLAMTRQMLSALHAAHTRRVLHRDIKPENILMCPTHGPEREIAKLVDFGLAKSFGEQNFDDDLEITLVKTKAGGFMGTPRYTSPEQAVGDPVGPYTDLFSLGLVISEWLSGTIRLKGDTHAELMRYLVGPQPLDVSDCPRAWQPWLAQLLDKEPKRRFSSARQAMDALEHILKHGAAPGGIQTESIDAYDLAASGYFADALQVDGPISFLDSDAPLELDLERVAKTTPVKQVTSPHMAALPAHLLGSTPQPQPPGPPQHTPAPRPGMLEQQSNPQLNVPQAFQGTNPELQVPQAFHQTNPELRTPFQNPPGADSTGLIEPANFAPPAREEQGMSIGTIIIAGILSCLIVLSLVLAILVITGS